MLRCLPATLWLALTGLAGAQTVAGRFSLKERFGVSYPEQPVEFAYSGGQIRSARMLGPGGEEVPYQQLSTGAVLIRTRLPASRIATAYQPSQIDPRGDTITINLNMLTGAYPAIGD